MKPNHIRAELIRLEIRLSDVARMCKTSRQTVWRAIRDPAKRGKGYVVRRKISEIIGLEID